MNVIDNLLKGKAITSASSVNILNPSAAINDASDELYLVSIRTFDNYISLINGNNAEQCGMNGFCSNQFVVEGDGSVYPCDFYCTDEWLLGNINESSFKQMYKTSKCVEFIKSSFKLDDKCKECKYFYICRGGGCRRNRESSDYCLAYRQFFSQCEDKLKTLKKVGVN